MTSRGRAPGLLGTRDETMGRAPQVTFDVAALHGHLSAKLAELRPLVVRDVMRVVLEVSSLPCEKMLWSIAFAFDEDDGRIARIEACFNDHEAPLVSDDELDGYEVQLLLPKILPKRPPGDPVRAAAPALGSASARDSLVTRFCRALAELGAYRTIEEIEAVSVDVYLR